MTLSKSTASGFLNGRFVRMFIDMSDGTGAPSWTVIGGELDGKWTIDPQLEDYTTKDSDAIVYYPTRYKWNGSFNTNYLDDDDAQTRVRDVALSVGQPTPVGAAYGPTVRVGWRIQEDVTGAQPTTQSHMVGKVALKVDYDMTDAKMGKMAVTFTGSGAIDLATSVGP